MLPMLLSLFLVPPEVSTAPPIPIDRVESAITPGKPGGGGGPNKDVDCTVYENFTGPGFDLPLRGGNPNKFGLRHIEIRHPNAYLPKDIQDTLSHGDCEQQFDNRFKCHLGDFSVVYDTEFSNSCPDGKRLGIVTAFFD